MALEPRPYARAAGQALASDEGGAQGALPYRTLLRLRQTWGYILSKSFTNPVWFLITDWFAVYLVANGFKLEVVLGLQIAVNDPLVVRRRKAAGHLNRAFRRLAHCERAAREPFTQRLAIEQFHNRVGPPVVGAEIENRHDVRMQKRSDRFRFVLEPRQSVDVLRKPGRKDLDGYVAIEASVPGIIDFAHPAGPKGSWISYRPRRMPGVRAKLVIIRAKQSVN